MGPYDAPVRRSELVVDLVAMALPVVGTSSVAAAVLFGVWFTPWCSVGFLALAVVSFVLVWRPRRRVHAAVPHAGVRLMAVNMWFANKRTADGVRDVVAAAPDVVVVSELTGEAHRAFAAAFEFHEVLTVGGAKGHGVFARLPLERLPDPMGIGPSLHVRVGAAQPFHLLAVHLPRPVLFAAPSDGTAPFGYFEHCVDHLVELVAQHDDTVVAGDLNLTDRQAGYGRLIAGRLDAMRTGRARATFRGSPKWRMLSFRIDHIVVPAGWGVAEARRVHIAGSDHLGVTAVVGRPAPNP